MDEYSAIAEWSLSGENLGEYKNKIENAQNPYSFAHLLVVWFRQKPRLKISFLDSFKLSERVI